MQAASQRVVRISKELSLLLRHKPPAGLMDGSGWISVPALLPHLKSKPSLDDIKLVVDSSDKVRCLLLQLERDALLTAHRAAAETLCAG
jgi:RNA:NAD 2'-phosphotransferase (TPT1/KptA family)